MLTPKIPKKKGEPSTVQYVVVLKGIKSPNQILTIVKTIKELTSLGLKESKQFVDALPKSQAILRTSSKEEAEAAKTQLEKVGAVVEVIQPKMVKTLENIAGNHKKTGGNTEETKKDTQETKKDTEEAKKRIEEVEKIIEKAKKNVEETIKNAEKTMEPVEKTKKNVEKMEKKEDLTNLLPIKGISFALKKSLGKNCGIYDIAGLLCSGQTLDDRKSNIADKLNVDVRYVTLWLKQADLWRVTGMTSDDAYMLVLAGVRHTADLAKVDIDKIMPVLETIAASHPDLQQPSMAKINDYIIMAKAMQALSSTKTFELVVNEEKEPVRLFKEEVELDLLSDSEIINKGLGFLQDIAFSLPLPRTLSGHVKMSKNKEVTECPDIKVTLTGISSPTEDKQEESAELFGYTDATGYFSIVLPDKYNMQPAIVITLTQGGNKQTFIKQSSELIDKTYIPNGGKKDGKVLYAKELIALFDDLDSTNKDIITLERRINTWETINASIESIPEEERADAMAFMQLYPKGKSEESLKELTKKRKTLLDEIYGADPTTNDFERTLTNLLSRTDLDSDMGELVINYDVFTNNHNDKPRALPSVKLMGENDNAVRLPTDTAPSRVFTYNMLQRLVEPNVTPPATKEKPRTAIDKPIDASNFKVKLAENPESITKMASLGIGYVLNMHQAWVPDGFALGSLLYSTILAPGEEQRLVVRENTQSYRIEDMTEGSEAVGENYVTSQDDDTSATYNYAMQQLSTGESSADYSTHSAGFGLSGGGSYGGFTFGLNCGYNYSSGKASSSARQSNAHDEASASAQHFQHGIKTASERIAQAKRVSVRAATSSETDSVATRIIANHNHSHAMTIQYWEVMRRYKLETCIDGIDLVLFVPLEPIRFLPQGESFYLKKNDIETFNKQRFAHRYDTLLKNYDALSSSLPAKYRTGLNLIQRYASYPDWKMENVFDKTNSNKDELSLTLNGRFLECDDLTVTVYFSNGKASIKAGLYSKVCSNINGKDGLIETLQIRTTKDLKEQIAIAKRTGKIGKIVFKINLPAQTSINDIASIRVEYACSPLNYKLFIGYDATYDDDNYIKEYDPQWTAWERKAVSNYRHKLENLYQDNDDSKNDRIKISHYSEALPENYRINEVQNGAVLSPSVLKSIGALQLDSIQLTDSKSQLITDDISTYSLQYNRAVIDMTPDTPVLRYNELQSMELALQYVASETMRYSQRIWSRLTDSELAMMLEKYTISLGKQKSGKGKDNQDLDKTLFDTLYNDDIDISLLNCINVKKMLGFYGNCILFPFTYPESLAERLGKTSAELQDALYRYHATSFRVPSTVISLPTKGMIGEAVLGETNVSEEIDLTRFWNWKDSPIDSMEITKDYLNGKDYLENKSTRDLSSLNLTSATATTPVTVSDLISALVGKQTPQFDNITGLDAITTMLGGAAKTNTEAQTKALENSTNLVTAILDQKNKEKAIEKGINPYGETPSKENNPKATPNADKQNSK